MSGTRKGLRVALVVGSARTGGTERQMFRLARELSDRGLSVLVVTEIGGPLSETLKGTDVEHNVPPQSRLQTSRSLWVRRVANGAVRVRSRFGLHAALRLHDTHLLHAFLPEAIVTAFRSAQTSGVQPVCVAGLRGETRDSGTRPWSLSTRLSAALTNADAVVVNSPHLVDREAVRLGVDPQKVHVIPNGVDIPGWQADPSQSPPVAVVVANLRQIKGYEVLLEALSRMQYPLTVRACGEGERRALLRSQAEKFGVADRFTIVPAPADVEHELRSAQIGVHPSLSEGLSNAIMEEMAAGLPVVCTDVGGVRLQVSDGRNGYLVEPSDAGALAQALDRMVADPALRTRLGSASREQARSFSWEACVDRHVELYERLVSARK